MKKPKLPEMTADAPAAFLKEVDEALHAERMLTLWKEWRHAIVVFVVVLVACTAGWQGYKAWKARAEDKYATAWYVATKGDAPVIPDGMEDAPQPGYRALAAFALAKEAMKANPANVDAAAKAYMQVADDSGSPAWLRDWAALNAALVQTGRNPDAAKALLDKLTENDASPMQAPALELRAVLAQQDGDSATARQLTTRLLALPNLPPQLTVRAKQRLGELSTLAN